MTRIAWYLSILGIGCGMALVWFFDDPAMQIRGLAVMMVMMWTLEKD